MDILLILRGIIIGIGKIIPGVSGSVMAVSMGIYDKAISCVIDFFSNIRGNIKFLFNLGLGIIIGIILFSRVIVFFLNNYYLYTMFIFLVLIIMGTRGIIRNSDKSVFGIIIFVISFVIMSIFSFININNSMVNINDYMLYFLSGILEGIGSIVVGISSTALLSIFGVYDLFIRGISNLFYFDMLVIIFFLLGLFISVFLCILLMGYLFKKYRSKTYSFILGVFLSNVIVLIINVFKNINTIKDLIIGIVSLGLGIVVSILS